MMGKFADSLSGLTGRQPYFPADEASFRALMDIIPAMVWVCDAEGVVLFSNERWLEYVGLDADRALSQGWRPFLHWEDEDAFLEAWQTAIQRGMPFEAEARFRGRDGEARWFLVRARPAPDAKGGEGFRYVTATDIHDRKLTDEGSGASRQRETISALEQSAREAQALFANAMEAVLLMDGEGHFQRANPSACRKLGRPLEGIIGHTFSELLFPDAPDAFAELWKTLMAEGSLSGEMSYTTPAGLGKDLEFSAVANCLPGQHLLTMRDITARKRAERGLLESEERFRAMAESAPLFIWLSGPDGQVKYVNQTWCDFLGLKPEDVISFGMRDAVPIEELTLHSIRYREAFERREPFSIEARVRDRNGDFRWLLSKGAPLFSQNGELAGYIGTSIDITDRKETEELLRKTLEREQLIRRIVEITGQSFDIDYILKTVAEEIGLYLKVDRSSVNRYSVLENGEFSIDMSAQYYREGLSEVDPEDIKLITNATRYLNPEQMAEGRESVVNISDQEGYIAYLSRRLESIPQELPGLTTEKLADIIRKYGVRSSLRVNIFYRGVPYGSISVSQCERNRIWETDEVELLKMIAEHVGGAIYQAELYRKAQDTARNEQQVRRELEVYARRLEASNAELEQFATIASHDLQEPLRKIQLFSEMLDNADPDESHEYLQRMRKAAGRMQVLINDLLTLSRVNRKGNPFRSLDLDRVLRNVLDDMQVAVREADAEIEAEPLMTVRADEGQIHQLFQNLIGNALKYHRDGVPPVIRIYGRPTAGGDWYRIVVEDNGIGIKPEYYGRIFEPFQRLHGIGKYPGTGMGLTICKKIIDRHGGSIEVDSEPGEGSRFSFNLPLVK